MENYLHRQTLLRDKIIRKRLVIKTTVINDILQMRIEIFFKDRLHSSPKTIRQAITQYNKL